MTLQLHRARMMNEGSIGKLLFPDVKQKLPKDYHKENMEKMRKREHDRQNKIEEEKNMPKKDPWKMKRFQSVDGKVAQYIGGSVMQQQPSNVSSNKRIPLQNMANGQQPAVVMEAIQKRRPQQQAPQIVVMEQAAPPRYAHSIQPPQQQYQQEENIFSLAESAHRGYEEQLPPVGQPRSNHRVQPESQLPVKSRTKEPVQRSSELLSKAPSSAKPGGGKNYISENRNKAIHEKPPAPKEVSPNGDRHRNFGKVPGYINKYRNEAEDRQERIRLQEEEAKIPPGTRLMGDEERLSTLADLHATKKEVSTMLERMPIAQRTQAAERRKRELEEKLTRIERAIETFSKKTVYIAL